MLAFAACAPDITPDRPVDPVDPVDTIITPPVDTIITPPADTIVTPPVDTIITPPVDTTVTPDPVEPVVGPEDPAAGYATVSFPYKESFSGTQGDFVIVNVTLPQGFSYIWQSTSSYGMKATAYDSKTKSNKVSDSWLISPYVDLSKASDIHLNFEHVQRYATSVEEQLTLYVRIKGGSWKQLSIPKYSDGSNWTFVESGDINLSAYAGQQLQIAFRYLSNETAAATWEIQNVSIAAPDPPVSGGGWLELPAATTAYPNAVQGTLYASSDRNYTYLYDKDTYTSYWVAYPLYASTQGGSRVDGWEDSWNPYISKDYQIPTWLGGYGVDYVYSNGTSDYYARGHQIPDADRNNHSEMQKQTYYATNMTPQVNNNFNAAVWMYLESQVRSYSKATDTLYVVTGAIHRKVGGSETITYVNHCKDSAKRNIPVPNYYYKVLMKVKRSGSTVTSACGIGYWMDHFAIYSNPKTDYNNCVFSIDQIEEWTGFDFFANLPDSVEASAEQVSSTTTFSNFK